MTPLPDHGLTPEERGDRLSGRRRVLTFAAIVAVIAAAVTAIAFASRDTTAPDTPAAAASSSATPQAQEAVLKDPAPLAGDIAQAGLVDTEDTRIWTAVSRGTRTAHGIRTLVLDKRDEGAYSIEDLIKLGAANRTNKKVVTLEQPVVIRSGATLKIHAPGQTLRLASNGKSLASIVAWGGTLSISGSAKTAVTVVGWDTKAKAADTNLTDGRGYLRAHSGRLDLEHVDLRSVGFWSGRTGGAASTGTTFDPGHATIRRTSIEHSHIGLYLLNTEMVSVMHSTISGSDRFGIEMDRSRRVRLHRVTVTTSGLSAVHAHDHSSHLQITSSTMSDNDGYGINVDGRPQADGPNTLGYGVRNATDLKLSNVSIRNNALGGVQVVGTDKVTLTKLTVDEEHRAVRILGRSKSTMIEHSDLTASRGTVIAVKDQAQAVILRDNTVVGNTLGIQVEESPVEVSHNTIRIVKGSALSATGPAATLQVHDNVLIGKGPKAFAVGESTPPLEVADNTAEQWNTTHPLVEWMERNPFAPLWLAILLIPLVGIVFIARRYRRHRDLRRLTEDTVIAMAKARRAGVEQHPVAEPVAEPVLVPAAAQPLPVQHVLTPRTDRIVVRGAMGQFASAQDLAIHAVLEGGRSPQHVARTLQVSESVVRDWVRQHLEG